MSKRKKNGVEGSAFEVSAESGSVNSSAFETNLPPASGSAFETSEVNGSAFETSEANGSAFETGVSESVSSSAASYQSSEAIVSENSVKQALSAFDSVSSVWETTQVKHEKSFVLEDTKRIPHTLWDENILKDQGAMGVVSTATLQEESSEQKVLIKRIQGDATSHREEAILFSNEALITCECGSRGRHLANGKFMGKDSEGRLFLVMEFYDGKNLEKKIEEKTYERDTGACKAVIRGILEGLSELHEQGVVHRDLKPANVLVRDNGVPVLIDFGLAKKNGVKDLDVSTIGTFGYAAPEQQDGLAHEVQYSADIYSVGIIFLEMLTPDFSVREAAEKFAGKVSFNDPNRAQKLQARLDAFRKIIDEQIAKLDENNAGEFKNFILKCLEKNPDERYQNGQDAFEQFISIATQCRNEFKRKCIDPYWNDGEVDDGERDALTVEAKKMGVSDKETIDDFKDAKKSYDHYLEHVRLGLKGHKDYDRASLLKEAERRGYKPIPAKDFKRIVEEERAKLMKNALPGEKNRIKKALVEKSNHQMYALVAVLVLVLAGVLIQSLFTKEESPIPTDPKERNALLLTTSGAGDAIYTSRLLKAGAFIDTQDSLGMTPLHRAVELGAIPTVDTLLNHSPNVNMADQDGWTPLFKAAWLGNAAITERLIQHNANVGALDNRGRSAIVLALQKKHDGVVLTLLKHMTHADINSQYVVMMDYAQSDKAKQYLTEAKNKVDQIKEAIENDDVDRLKSALAYRFNADLTYTDSTGKTWAHVAAASGSIKCIAYLSSLSLDMNVKDSLGQTAIFALAKDGSVDVAKALVAAGADIQVENRDGKSFISLIKSRDMKKFVTDRMYADSLFIRIAVTGNQNEMERYIAEGAHVDAKDGKGNSALAYAVQRSDVNTIKFLMSKGARVNDAFEKGNTLMHFAAKNDDVKVMSELFAAHADYNAKNAAGQTPLMVAVSERKLKAIDLLLAQENISVVDVDNDMNNMMHYAAKAGNIDLMKKIQPKVDANAYNKERKTPLHLAAAAGSLECVQMLEEIGLPLSFKDAYGKKAVDYARVPQVRKFLFDNENKNELIFGAVKNRNFKSVQEFISFGAKVNASDLQGIPLLHHAIARDTSVLSLLLKNGADVNAVDTKKETALFKAIRSKMWDAMKCLVAHGSNTSVVNENGEKIIHVAAATRDTSLVKWTLTYVSVNALDGKKETALYTAIRNNDYAMATFLMRKGVNAKLTNAQNATAMNVADNRTSTYVANVTYSDERFLNAVGRDDFKQASFYLSLGANVNAFDPSHSTAACNAAKSDALNRLKYLEKNGANLNIECNSMNPLGWTIYKNNMKSFNYLVKSRNVSIGMQQSNGYTPLQMAVNQRNSNMVLPLIKRGGVNTPNKEGKTALVMAIERNMYDMVLLLLNNGANQRWRSSNGDAPIHVAARTASGEIVKLLISKGANVEEKNGSGDDPLDIAKQANNTSAYNVIDDAHSWSLWKWIKVIAAGIFIALVVASCFAFPPLIAVYVVLFILFVKFCSG